MLLTEALFDPRARAVLSVLEGLGRAQAAHFHMERFLGEEKVEVYATVNEVPLMENRRRLETFGASCFSESPGSYDCL